MSATMDELTARAASHLAVLERLRGDLEALTAERRADDGRVTVRLDASGGLAALILQPGAGGGDATALGRVIVEAAAEAGRELNDRRSALTDEFLGEFGVRGESGDTPPTMEPETAPVRLKTDPYSRAADRQGDR